MFYIYHCLNLTAIKQRTVTTFLCKIRTLGYEILFDLQKKWGESPSRLVQWLRIHLATQGTPVGSLVQGMVQPTLWGLGSTAADARIP